MSLHQTEIECMGMKVWLELSDDEQSKGREPREEVRLAQEAMIRNMSQFLVIYKNEVKP